MRLISIALFLVGSFLTFSCSDDAAVKSTGHRRGATNGLSASKISELKEKCSDSKYAMGSYVYDEFKGRFSSDEAISAAMIFNKILEFEQQVGTQVEAKTMTRNGDLEGDQIESSTKFFIVKDLAVFISKDRLCVSLDQDPTAEAVNSTDVAVALTTMVQNGQLLAQYAKVGEEFYDVFKEPEMEAFYKLFKVKLETEEVEETTGGEADEVIVKFGDGMWSGTSDPKVLQVQKRLNELGQYGTLDEDGKYGNGTRVAIEKFQEANGLTVNGREITKTCWDKLFEGTSTETTTGEAANTTTGEEATTTTE